MSPGLVEVDHTLTSGYARVHALEAEWLRIQRSPYEPETHVREQHAERKRELETQLVALRVSLARLREAAQAVAEALDAAGPAHQATHP